MVKISRSGVLDREYFCLGFVWIVIDLYCFLKIVSNFDVLEIFVSQEHRAEIDARDSTFQTFEDFGKDLLDKEHYASPDIREKLDTMATEREELEK